ncbi:MAG: tannase/feruloyl esterase family alpha/beta hydrolase, partial [Microvirga sp.]
MRIPSLVLVPTALAFFGWADPVRAADPAVVAPVKTCADLKTLDLSRGGDVAVRIDSADEIKDGARTFCAVKGYVQPQVNFEVRLPLANWSQRYLQLGCGGYCGG